MKMKRVEQKRRKRKSLNPSETTAVVKRCSFALGGQQPDASKSARSQDVHLMQLLM